MGLKEPPVRIRHAADLFEVLSSGSLGARLAVLRDIQRDPKRAVALGPHEGEDFVDLMVRMIPESTGPLKRLQTLCLMSYDDPRTTKFLTEEFARCKDAATVLYLGKRLHMSLGADFFRPFLWHEKTAQALASSRVCSGLERLEPSERLRIAVLLDQKFEPPPIVKDTLDLWVKELAGRHRLRTRQLAEERGAECLRLWTRWDELAEEEQEWLLFLTERLDPSLLRQSVTALMKMDASSVVIVRAALRLELELPRALLSNTNADVRAIAVSEGMADDSLERYLAEKFPLPVVLAAVGRCHTDKLLDLLSDRRWQVRSEALGVLSRGTDRPLQEVRRLTKAEDLGPRAAAVELLLAWGDQPWLETHFLG